MKLFSKIFTTLVMVAAFLPVYAVELQDSTIIGHFNSLPDKNVKVVQPAKMAERLQLGSYTVEKFMEENESHSSIGYRVQVFADANSRTARREAISKRNNIIGAFPGISTYLFYDAPAWRLRVGDFKTREEAVDFKAKIAEIFPSYSRELIIVRDRINTEQ